MGKDFVAIRICGQIYLQRFFGCIHTHIRCLTNRISKSKQYCQIFVAKRRRCLTGKSRSNSNRFIKCDYRTIDDPGYLLGNSFVFSNAEHWCLLLLASNVA